MNVKGSAISARVRWVEERGVAEVARFLSALSSKTRVVIEHGVQAGEWYPLPTFVEVCQVIDELFGEGDLKLCPDLGRYACRVNLTSLYRFLFKVGNVHFIIRRAAAAWRINYDKGEMVVVSEGPTSCVLEVRDVPQPHRAHCLSVLGWVLEAGYLSNAGERFRLVHERCRVNGDEECELAFEWG